MPGDIPFMFWQVIYPLKVNPGDSFHKWLLLLPYFFIFLFFPYKFVPDASATHCKTH